MPISIRKDVAYAILQKINSTGEGLHEVSFTETDLTGLDVNETDLLGHLDYLNQNHYINAEFTGNAYGKLEEVAENLAHPEPIKFKKAQLTDKGSKMLEKIKESLSKNPTTGPAVAIGTKDQPFLEKVMLKGGLGDIFDARDISEVVFRVMRDLMTTEAADRVEEELHKPAEITDDKSLQMEIADLWHDTNPIVGFLSRVRPPWQGPGIFKIDSDRFLFRVANEGGLQPNVDREQAVKAVFSATKDELSAPRIAEIASWLPDHVRQLWEQA